MKINKEKVVTWGFAIGLLGLSVIFGGGFSKIYNIYHKSGAFLKILYLH